MHNKQKYNLHIYRLCAGAAAVCTIYTERERAYKYNIMYWIAMRFIYPEWVKS